MIDAFLTYFNIHRRFRNGVFSLFVIISTLCISLFLLEDRTGVVAGDLVSLEDYEDALQQLKKRRDAGHNAYKRTPFNPNFISDYKGYVLGIPVGALDKIRSYRETGRWINSTQEFQQVTGITDSLLHQLTPLFKFPEFKPFKKNNNRQHIAVRSSAQKSDLNLVTASILQEVVGLPDFIAQRVVDYRNKLGGFIGDIQLEDVYGLYPKQRKKVLSLFTVKKTSSNALLNINTASAKELMTVPYFDFEMALAIKDFIKENGAVKSFYEFDKINGFPIDKINRIALYLEI